MSTTDQLAAIEARANDPFGTSMQGVGQVDADRDALLAMVREQQARLDKVTVVADRAEIHEESAYTGPKGSMGEWERGFNDGKAAVAEAIRAALTATEGA
jgi:hypothetical protein